MSIVYGYSVPPMERPIRWQAGMVYGKHYNEDGDEIGRFKIDFEYFLEFGHVEVREYILTGAAHEDEIYFAIKDYFRPNITITLP